MTAYLIAKERDAVAVRMDRVCRWIFPAAFAALMLGLYFEVQLPLPQQS